MIQFKKGDKILFEDFEYNDFQEGIALNDWQNEFCFAIRLADETIVYINKENKRTSIKLSKI
jgi:hypothetical protein